MSLNKVILIGNVGKDPDVRYFDSGSAIASFPLATSERGYTLANGTVIPERTEWHNIVARRDQVPFVEKWVKKGSGLYVEGKIRTRNYEDQSGIRRYVTEIYADRIEFYNTGSSNRDGFGTQTAGQQPQAASTAGNAVQSGAAPQATTYQQPAQQPSNSFDNNEVDDLPF